MVARTLVGDLQAEVKRLKMIESNYEAYKLAAIERKKRMEEEIADLRAKLAEREADLAECEEE